MHLLVFESLMTPSFFKPLAAAQTAVFTSHTAGLSGSVSSILSSLFALFLLVLKICFQNYT